MMRVVATAGLLVALCPTAGVAERNLVPTLDISLMSVLTSLPSHSGCKTSIYASPTNGC